MLRVNYTAAVEYNCLSDDKVQYVYIAFELRMLCTEALSTMLYVMRKYNMYD